MSEGTVLYSVVVRLCVRRGPDAHTEIDGEVFAAVSQRIEDAEMVDILDIEVLPEPPDAKIIAFPKRD